VQTTKLQVFADPFAVPVDQVAVDEQLEPINLQSFDTMLSCCFYGQHFVGL